MKHENTWFTVSQWNQGWILFRWLRKNICARYYSLYAPLRLIRRDVHKYLLAIREAYLTKLGVIWKYIGRSIPVAREYCVITRNPYLLAATGNSNDHCYTKSSNCFNYRGTGARTKLYRTHCFRNYSSLGRPARYGYRNVNKFIT